MNQDCTLCGKEFDPQQPLTDPAQIAGQHLARQEYGDDGLLCGDCLGSRGRLAMMYRSDFFN